MALCLLLFFRKTTSDAALSTMTFPICSHHFQQMGIWSPNFNWRKTLPMATTVMTLNLELKGTWKALCSYTVLMRVCVSAQLDKILFLQARAWRRLRKNLNWTYAQFHVKNSEKLVGEKQQYPTSAACVPCSFVINFSVCTFVLPKRN